MQSVSAFTGSPVHVFESHILAIHVFSTRKRVNGGFAVTGVGFHANFHTLVSGGLSMGVTVRIPSPLRQYTENLSEVVLEGNTVRELLESFKVRFPDAGTRFFSAKTSRYMNLYLNDRDIRSLSDLDTPVAEKDILSIVFAIAGG
jgi:molybdopterin synthase sulfur carrier subunit